MGYGSTPIQVGGCVNFNGNLTVKVEYGAQPGSYNQSTFVQNGTGCNSDFSQVSVFIESPNPCIQAIEFEVLTYSESAPMVFFNLGEVACTFSEAANPSIAAALGVVFLSLLSFFS